jgi:hypothetical protein
MRNPIWKRGRKMAELAGKRFETPDEVRKV